MLDQPANNSRSRRRRTRFTTITADLDRRNVRDNIIAWPVSRVRKAHSSAFALQKNPDCQLIMWLAEIMIYLHKSRARRARWSGPCGLRSCCRLDP
jgi:hypothetical protein